MGLGNGNPNSGNKGSNYAYELKNVRALGELLNSVKRHGTTTLATEATLISVLNAIIASDQDIEILLVRDTGNANKVVQQITNYETGTPVVSYKDVDGNPYVPVGPLEYLDPSAITNLMLTELIAINANTIEEPTALVSSSTTAGGTIPAGSKAATIFIDGPGGQINTVIRPDGWSQTFEFNNDTLPDITYNGNGTATMYVDILT